MAGKEIKKETIKKDRKTPVKFTAVAVSHIPEGKYFEATGGRKTSVARVRLFAKGGGITVNGMDFKQYFQQRNLQKEVRQPFETADLENKVTISAKVSGGGSHSQATALVNGISKVMALFNPELRKKLRKAGFITRDPRMVERKKYGYKKARRAPQWAKR